MIIGVTGMPLAGKTTIADILVEEGFTKVDMGDVVREEMKNREIPTSRTGKFVNDIRKENGMEAIAKLTAPKIKQKKQEKIVITGMRSLEEKEYFENSIDYQIKMVAAWASKETRKERRKQRMREEDRKGDDFEERDRRELSNGVGDLIALSNKLIINEDKTINQLKEEVKTKCQIKN